MSNIKALKALELIEQPLPEKQPSHFFALTIRLPGELAERVISLHDYGPAEGLAQPAKGDKSATPNRPFVSRNSLLIALIEAGLEAVESVSKPTT